MTRTLVLLTLWLAAGCSPRSEPPAARPQATPVSVPPPLQASTNEPAAHAGNEAVVTVDGARLTRAERDRLVAMLTASQLAGAETNQLPAATMEAVRQQMEHRVLRQFVTRTLLVKEADRQGLVVTPEEDREIAERLDAVASLVTNRSLSMAEMRDDLRARKRIDKLLQPYVTNAVEVAPDEIAAFRARNAESVILPDLVRALHFLVSLVPGDADAVRAAKRDRIERVRKEILGGADFGDLARKMSDCHSASKGGDLGFLARRAMPAAVEEAMLSLPTNELSHVIESPFGYHLIRVIERQMGHAMDDAAVAEMIRERKRVAAIDLFIESLRKKATIQTE